MKKRKILLLLSPIVIILRYIFNYFSKEFLIILAIILIFMIFHLVKQQTILSIKVSQSNGGAESSTARDCVFKIQDKYGFQGIIGIANIENLTPEFILNENIHFETSTKKEWEFWLWKYREMKEDEKLRIPRFLKATSEEDPNTITFFKTLINNNQVRWITSSLLKKQSYLFHEFIFNTFYPIKNNKEKYNRIRFFVRQSVDIAHGYYQYNLIYIIGNNNTQEFFELNADEILKDINDCLDKYDWSLVTKKKEINQ